ncbi:MAG TPA: DegT/DnrJ/EryC1/StrS family aminotransferase, partial [Ruminiclostridium sp.]|nr:DegT/DnrJ/EryC1/StrS family aminotransferase [Ruminiclostridium sp.]
MELAIKGGKSLRSGKKWSNWPIWNNSANQYIDEVIHSNRWSVRGAWTGQEAKEITFSRKFCEYTGTKYCVLTTTGTMGLMISLEALDISFGDEVIVPALTWIAPVTAILNVGAIPVMVDVEKETTCIDPESIRKAIGPKTKGIIAVHLHCSIANIEEIIKISKEHNLYVIEDCSQAHGAVWEDRYVGTIGDVGVFSMNQEKLLTCGEGGAVITNNPQIYERLFRTKTDGCKFEEPRRIEGEDQLIYDKKCMGSNFCISEFQAAVLLSQLENLTQYNNRRRINARYLDEGLGEIQGLMPLK